MKRDEVSVWIQIDGFAARRIPGCSVACEKFGSAALHHVSSIHVDEWPVRTCASPEHDPVGVFERIGIAAVVK